MRKQQIIMTPDGLHIFMPLAEGGYYLFQGVLLYNGTTEKNDEDFKW